ncbi:MAG: hypothetical protein ABR923_14235 [Terracidiphilus sp.]
MLTIHGALPKMDLRGARGPELEYVAGAKQDSVNARAIHISAVRTVLVDEFKTVSQLVDHRVPA